MKTFLYKTLYCVLIVVHVVSVAVALPSIFVIAALECLENACEAMKRKANEEKKDQR